MDVGMPVFCCARAQAGQWWAIFALICPVRCKEMWFTWRFVDSSCVFSLVM